MESRFDDIVFHHLIEMPHCDCLFCVTKEKTTQKTRLFLIFHDEKRIYKRNGVKETWMELTDQQEYQTVRQGLNQAIEERKIPCFRY